MLNIVLIEPLIAGNVGTIGRLCFNLGFTLHLVGPHLLDFSDKKIMRAGLDYWPKLKPIMYADCDEFLASLHSVNQLKFASTKAASSVYDASFNKGDYLVFGSESFGLPQPQIQALLSPQNCFKIPMLPQGRSLNLAVSVGMFAALASAQIFNTPSK